MATTGAWERSAIARAQAIRSAASPSRKASIAAISAAGAFSIQARKSAGAKPASAMPSVSKPVA